MTNEPTINTSDATPGDVLLQLSYSSSGIEGQRARLTITDRMSGVTVASIDLTADQLLSLMSTTATPVSGVRLPKRPELVGRRQQTTSTSLNHNADTTAEQVRDAYLADGWDSVQIQPTNFGKRVVARRWLAEQKAEA